VGGKLRRTRILADFCFAEEIRAAEILGARFL
jgi:hypothetical protein